jgi:hypothetical protein
MSARGRMGEEALARRVIEWLHVVCCEEVMK